MVVAAAAAAAIAFRCAATICPKRRRVRFSLALDTRARPGETTKRDRWAFEISRTEESREEEKAMTQVSLFSERAVAYQAIVLGGKHIGQNGARGCYWQSVSHSWPAELMVDLLSGSASSPTDFWLWPPNPFVRRDTRSNKAMAKAKNDSSTVEPIQNRDVMRSSSNL